MNIVIDEPYFSQIVTRQKTIDVHLRIDKYLNLIPGMIINITNKNSFFFHTINALVVSVRNYVSFESLFQNEPFSKIIPRANTVRDAIRICYNFYHPDDEMKYGVVAIELKVI